MEAAGGQPGQPLPLNNQADTTSYANLFSFLLGRENYRQHEVTTVLALCHRMQQAAQSLAEVLTPLGSEVKVTLHGKTLPSQLRSLRFPYFILELEGPNRLYN